LNYGHDLRLNRSFVRPQNDRNVKGTADSYGYYVRRSRYDGETDRHIENLRANPDQYLADTEGLYSNYQPTRLAFVMGEAVDRLQGTQRDIYIKTMRQGMSIAEAGRTLGLSKGACQYHRDRAIAYVTGQCRLYCMAEELMGDVCDDN